MYVEEKYKHYRAFNDRVEGVRYYIFLMGLSKHMYEKTGKKLVDEIRVVVSTNAIVMAWR